MRNSKFDKTCIVCGTKYKYCGGCSNYKNKPRWMQSFHNDDCHKIFNTIMEYRTNCKTAAQCAEILRGCDLSYRDKINPDLNIFIDEIFANGEAVPTAEPVETVAEPVVEPEVVAVEEAFEKAVVEENIVTEEVAKDIVESEEKPQKKDYSYKGYKKPSYKKKNFDNEQ